MIIPLVILVALIGVFLLASFAPPLDRSPDEVANILASIRDGEPTGHWADDFIHIPIKNLALEQIREEFEQLVERYPTWEPQAPFPDAGVHELQALVGRANTSPAIDGRD